MNVKPICATCAKALEAGEENGFPFLVCAYKHFGMLTITNPDDTCPAYEPKQPKKGTKPGFLFPSISKLTL